MVIDMITPGYQMTEVGIISEDWKIKKFSDVVDGFSSGATPYRGNPEYYKGNIRWITSGELNYNIITDTNEKISPEAVKRTNLTMHPAGTFLMAITGLEAEGTRGRCGIIGAESTTNQSCMALYPKDNLSLEYLFHYYVFKGEFFALKYCQGTKQQSYTAKLVRNLPIAIPPTKDEQLAIAKVLSDINVLITMLEKLIEKKKNIQHSNLANDMTEAGYSRSEADQIKSEVKYYENVRTEIKLASGDYIDLKAYEPAMRHLIDTYIDAEESKKISAFDDLTIIDLIVKNGVSAVESLPENIRKNRDAVAEAIENNVRRVIVEEKPTNPKYFSKMSVLLDNIIRDRKANSINYAQYLKKIEELIQSLKNPSKGTAYPKNINSDSKRALYDNLDNKEEVALAVDEAILRNKPDGWRGNRIKERTVRLAIKKTLAKYGIEDENYIELVLNLAREQKTY